MRFKPNEKFIVIKDGEAGVVDEPKEDALIANPSEEVAFIEREVLAVTDGYRIPGIDHKIPSSFTVGDTVLINAYAGFKTDIEGSTVRIMKEDEVIGRVGLLA